MFWIGVCAGSSASEITGRRGRMGSTSRRMPTRSAGGVTSGGSLAVLPCRLERCGASACRAEVSSSGSSVRAPVAAARAEELHQRDLEPRADGDRPDRLPSPPPSICTITDDRARRTCSVSTSGSLVCSAASESASRMRHEVADRHALAQQPLQHAVQRAERELVRHHVLDQRRVRLLEPVEQLAHVLPAQQLGGVVADRSPSGGWRARSAASTTV